MKKAGREAAKAMDELEKRRGEREEAGERRRRAEEKLAQCNASWKLFKGKLGW
ncbi:unnamed protein product [Linum tenue]|uniref:Uncharacterized protein n=1 Tax=Linum tenue TaxID=586396 RepID=A0AAV0JDC7_9ROSI|nr:unnamed protein product [Linum tenue]